MKFERFEDLPIWQKAREICKQISVITSTGEFSTDYKLRDQIRGSSGSVMDNIAEGFERNGNKEFIQFLFVAKGSCGETRSQTYRAFDYKYISEEVCDKLVMETLNLSKEIFGLINYLKKSGFKGEKYL
jgi:four helix bundle protein